VEYLILQNGINKKFFASEAFMMIEHMEKSGKIEQIGSYLVYRMALPKP
jgi:hypothetical protein